MHSRASVLLVSALLLGGHAFADAEDTSRVRRQAKLPHPIARSGGRGLPRSPATEILIPPPPSDDPDADRIMMLQAALKDLVRSRTLSGARVGIKVVRAGDGNLLFAQNPDRLFDPASNEKILTTVTALANLGPEYRYKTELLGAIPDEEGTIAGDLYLRGSGDPSLTSDDLGALARKLAQRGVKRIEGGLILEDRGRPTGLGDQGLGDATLTIDRNTFAIRVSPGGVGEAPSVVVAPDASALIVNSARTTAKGRSRIRITVFMRGNRMVVSVTGRIPVGHAAVRVRRRPPRPALFVAATLLERLRELDIAIGPSIRNGHAPEAATVLAMHESHPLAVIIRASNKDSNNFVAERIFQTVGAERFGAPASTSKAQRAVIEYLGQLGLRPGTYYAANGSGLDHTNRITPDALVTVLRHVHSSLALAPDFLQSLAIAGIDGTIKKRFLGTDAVGLVRAKTGTLNGVSALSGYVGHKEDVLIFSILVQGFRARRLRDVRHTQVAMVREMMRFIRGHESRPMDPAVQEMDVESSTDETVDLPQDPDPPVPPTPVSPPETKP